LNRSLDVDSLDSFELNPLMQKTETTVFSNRAIERELMSLEQQIFASPDHVETPSAVSPLTFEKPDQIIYEEQLNENN